MPDHSYEEVRSAVIDILAGREKSRYSPDQFRHLEIALADVFERRDLPERQSGNVRTLSMHSEGELSGVDANTFLEVFWNLFREGVITIGLDRSNPQFPFFRVSTLGKRLIQGADAYFFHDVAGYEKLIRSQVPNIDDTTLLYLKEAMQAFRSGCILSTSVMMGVATEHTFLLLLETIEGNPKHQPTYASVQKERSILPKVNKFRTILDKNLAALPPEVREDLDTQFAGILAVIRTFRNDSGHPTGKIIDREQAYVLLNLFIPYAKKMYQLKDHFAQP